MGKELWEEQQEAKYRDHDLSLEDLPNHDVEGIKGTAVRNFVNSREADGTRLTISAFMDYLTSKGFRIVRKR